MVEEIKTRLAAIRPVYDEVQQLRGRRDALQTVVQARDAYIAFFVRETEELKKLERKKQALYARSRRDRLRSGRASGPQPPVSQPTSPPPRGIKTVKLARRRDKTLAARRHLKIFVTRWRHVLRLGDEIVGRINSIADDLERPWGEALMLLEWRVFEDDTPFGGDSERHLVRLEEWRAAFADYRRRLKGEIDTLEIRFRGFLGIWRLWKDRGSPEGKAVWEDAIARERKRKRDDIARLESEVKDLETRFGGGIV